MTAVQALDMYERDPSEANAKLAAQWVAKEGVVRRGRTVYRANHDGTLNVYYDQTPLGQCMPDYQPISMTPSENAVRVNPNPSFLAAPRPPTMIELRDTVGRQEVALEELANDHSEAIGSVAAELARVREDLGGKLDGLAVFATARVAEVLTRLEALEKALLAPPKVKKGAD